MHAWVNGSLVPDTSPTLSVLDHGFTVGDGVFETLKTVAGRPFALTRHLQRLARSAAGLGLPEPDLDQVARAVHQTIAGNDAADVASARLRITYSSGPGPLGSDRAGGPGTLAVVIRPAAPWPATTTVALAPWPRNERSPLSGLKTTSYAENAVTLAWAKQRGHSEALLANLAGNLCEGTGSNVFVVVAGELLTPSLASGCLAGITRALVLEWAGARETDIPVEVLEHAEEVFITSSTRDVHPVVAIGERAVAVGPVTTAARAAFAAAAANQIDP